MSKGKFISLITSLTLAFIFVFTGSIEARKLSVSGLDKNSVVKTEPSSVNDGFDYYTIEGKANKNQTVYLLADEDGNDPKDYQIWDHVKADKKGNFSFETSSANNSKAIYYVSTDKTLKKKSSSDTFNVKKIKSKVKVVLPVNSQTQAEDSSSNDSEKTTEIDTSKFEGMNYEEYLRNPKQYQKKLVTLTGTVFQYDDESRFLLVSFNGDPSQLVYIDIAKSVNTDQRFLDDDTVTVYGSFKGVDSYTTVEGRDNYVPVVYAVKIDNQGQ